MCGRYIDAKLALQQHGAQRPLPRVFIDGGDPRARKDNSWWWPWEDQRVHAVMGLVQLHEGEFRVWHQAWGNLPGGTYDDWQRFSGPAPLADGFWNHYQLQTRPVTSGSRSNLDHARQFCPTTSEPCFTSSTILRTAAGLRLNDAYESRNVFIVSLPEILLFSMQTRTAKEVYEKWEECEVIIGKRARRGMGR